MGGVTGHCRDLAINGMSYGLHVSM